MQEMVVDVGKGMADGKGGTERKAWTKMKVSQGRQREEGAG